MKRHGIENRRDGSYRVHLRPEERQLLHALPAHLDDAFDVDDPALRRLFPPAYEGRDEELEYQQLVGASLLERKRAALRALADTAELTQLDEPQLSTWLDAIESLRLVLGTQLDVDESTYASGIDTGDPDAPRLALFHWLSWLQEEIVQALSQALP